MKSLLFTILIVVVFASHARQDKSVLSSEQKEVVSFIYHRFNDDRYRSTNTSIDNFEAHIRYLKENGFNIVTFSEAVDYLKSSRKVEKMASITVDDGYKSFYDHAFPILKKHKATATVFVTTNNINGGDFMDWSELKELRDYGIEIGNHSSSHDYFLNLPQSRRYDVFKSDIEQSQNVLKNGLGSKPKVFAYPYGELDSGMEKVVQKMDFKAAAAQNSGVMSHESNFFRLPRFPMSDSYAEIEGFTSKANMKSLTPTFLEPNDFLLKAANKESQLTLHFSSSNLLWDRTQCFIQGNECELVTSELPKDEIMLKARPKSRLKQRRTLYTITVPDKSGKWHWFSHLFINPKVK